MSDLETNPAISAVVMEAARRLTEVAVTAVTPASAGSNSRLYRVDTKTGPLALKSYPTRAGDLRRRSEVEWQTLMFLRERGMDVVPEPFRCDPERQFLLMEWIEGIPIIAPLSEEVSDAAGFIAKIFAHSADPEAAGFSLASEACLSAAIIAQQIEERLAHLGPDSEISTWIARTFVPALAKAQRVLAGELSESLPLPPSLRRLIPADFGFHNAIRQPDGRVRYIDFDYFGWDDPVKLAADIYLHPAMTLTQNQAGAFVTRMAQALPGDTDFRERFNRHLPLYALRWALIVLNPFRLDRADELPQDEPAGVRLREIRIGVAQRLLARGAIPFRFDV